MRRVSDRQEGFTLVELLVVVIIVGILAAIAIPRFLDQRTRANDTMAISDLRNLMIVETSLEASTGLTEDEDEIADEGWQGSDAQIRVCADLNAAEDDVTLIAWHVAGDLQYTWTRSQGVIESNDVTLEQTCAAQALGSNEVWPYP